jgi:sporulation protein YlmC with PRC-barrel domain
MEMQRIKDVAAWRGLPITDADGDKIGTIEDVFLDRHSGRPGWAAVKTGLFGRRHTLVPLRDSWTNPNGEIVVPFQKEVVKAAPQVEPGEQLPPEEERRLWEHYGLTDYDEWQGSDRTRELGLADEREDFDMVAGEPGGPPVLVRLRRIVIVAVPAEPPPPGPTGL